MIEADHFPAGSIGGADSIPSNSNDKLKDQVAEVRNLNCSRAEIEAEVRTVLAERGQLPVDCQTLGTTDNLYDAGLTSHATVKVMLALEDRFDFEFPDELLDRSLFDQIAKIAEAIQKLHRNG